MPAKRTDFKAMNERARARHGDALTYAKGIALETANQAARTSFTNPEQGKDDPTFRRIYVQAFAAGYSLKIHGK